MENDQNLRPKVGVGALIFKDGKLLLSRRKGTHFPGVYGSGGGHLENLESFEECIKREIREEAGIEIQNLRFLCIINFKRYAPKHYVDIGFVADWKSGEPHVCEPDKSEEWQWYDLNNLPQPLFKIVEKYIEAYKTGRHYFDE